MVRGYVCSAMRVSGSVNTLLTRKPLATHNGGPWAAVMANAILKLFLTALNCLERIMAVSDVLLVRCRFSICGRVNSFDGEQAK